MLGLVKVLKLEKLGFMIKNLLLWFIFRKIKYDEIDIKIFSVLKIFIIDLRSYYILNIIINFRYI